MLHCVIPARSAAVAFRSSFVGLVSLVAVLAAGCPDEPVAAPDPDGECVLDSDCTLGQVCMQGVCGANPNACGVNADCDAGQVCRDVCVTPEEGGECGSDADCATSERCTVEGDAGDGDCLPSLECVNAEPGTPCDDACYGHCEGRPTCDDDSDCAPTETCTSADGLQVCLPIGDCDADGDCPDFASCLDGQCVDNGACTVDDDCDVAQSCADGDCVRNDTCTADSDCPTDQRCNTASGLCERREPCTDDEDCAFDEVCDLQNDGGTCVVIGTCDTVDDCPVDPNIACLDGACTRAPCGRDSDCDDGLFCNGAETCNPRQGCAVGPPPTTAGLPACADEVCDEATDTLVLTPVASRCSDNSPCTDDVCDVTLGCLNPENDFVPAPGPDGDCVRTACVDGALATVNADNEVPTDQGADDDCRQAVCQGGQRVVINDDSETPPQGPTNDCRRAICQNGASVTVNDDTETPPQGADNDCVREVCSNGAVRVVADNTETPQQGPPNDCTRQVCQGGVVANEPANTETPPQGPTNDCLREVCQGGQSVSIANDGEVPAQASSTDCVTNVCVGGVVQTTPNNNEVPPQTSSTDCRRNVCQNGSATTVADNTETPPSIGCKDGVCVNGAPTTVADDGNCEDTAVCTNGTCNADGSCTQTPDDDLCNCGGGDVGLCLPGDARAGSGTLAGCVCLTPAPLSCGLDDGDDVKRVLERFELFANAPGAAAGSTFTWDIAGTPPGADPQAQLVGNATSAQAAFFQATSPSQAGQRDWVLRVTLQEPELPPQTCTVAVEAQPIPDTLEVTLFMNDSVDVDVHVMGGPGASQFDMPFHTGHDPGLGDDPDRDCYWENCAVCSVSIPGQTCAAVDPRVVDFSDPQNGASLADVEDPQLDIDNVRGCFINEAGERVCVPEKITVERPDAGTYFVLPYLWGPPLAEQPGQLTSPATVEVTLEVQCRGQRFTTTRTLSSANSDGTAAAANASVRHAGFEDIQIVVPTTGACTITE